MESSLFHEAVSYAYLFKEVFHCLVAIDTTEVAQKAEVCEIGVSDTMNVKVSGDGGDVTEDE